MIELRDYQRRALDAVRDAFGARSRRVLLTMPTGAGKTVCFCYLAGAVAAKGGTVAIVVHRRELRAQVLASLHAQNVDMSKITVHTIAKLVRRPTPPPTLAVLDEAHHVCAASWERVLSHWRDSWVLGVTATPCRLDGRPLGKWFDKLVVGPDTQTLVAAGHLCPAVVYAPSTVDMSGVRARMGDFDRVEAERRARTITGDVVEHHRRLVGHRQTIAFCCSIAHCREVAEALGGEVIHGAMPDAERDRLVARYRSGEVRILASCDIVSEGFDLPAIEAALLLRPTKSLAVHLQQVGRALRPWPGKKEALVLDHVGNTLRLGLPDEPQVWSLEGRPRRPNNPLALRTCKVCFAIAPLHKRVCPVCGEAFPPPAPRPAPRQIEGELQRLERRREVGRARTREDLERIAAARGYKPGWVKVMMKIRQWNKT